MLSQDSNLSKLKERLLYLNDDGKWENLTDWAKFYIDLGCAISNYNNPGNRLILGLSTPARAYAAVLISLGIIYAKISGENFNSDKNIYFDHICSLPLHARLLYTKNGRVYKAIFSGVSKLSTGEPVIKVQVQKDHERKSGGETYLLSADKILSVSIAAQSDFDLPNNPTGRKVSVSDNLARSLLSQSDFTRLTLESFLACIIVGRTNILRQEFKNTKFAAASKSGTSIKGTIQEIIKVRKFLGGLKTYNCNVLASNSWKPPKVVRRDVCDTVIFDGEMGFLKWRDRFESLNWIVVLDRTDPRYPEAETVLIQDYVQYRINADPPELFSISPKGLDLLLFEEVLR